MHAGSLVVCGFYVAAALVPVLDPHVLISRLSSKPVQEPAAGTPRCVTWDIAVSPKTAETDLIMNGTLRKILVNFSSGGSEPEPELADGMVRGFDTDAEVVQYLTSGSNATGGCRFGVEFMDTVGTYKLRFDAVPGGYVESNSPFREKKSWRTERSFEPGPGGQGPRGSDRGEDELDMTHGTSQPGYYQHHFIYWQHAINTAILATTLADDEEAQAAAMLEMEQVALHRFPFPEYLSDGYLFAIQFGLPFLLMLSLVYTALSITRNIVHEKEKKLKESMKMMGLRSWVHWAAWFALYTGMMAVSMFFVCIEIKYGQVLKNSEITLVFVFLILYSLSTISFCFMLSGIFSKASTAASGAGICFFMSYVPSFYVNREYGDLTLSAKHSWVRARARACARAFNALLRRSPRLLHGGYVLPFTCHLCVSSCVPHASTRAHPGSADHSGVVWCAWVWVCAVVRILCGGSVPRALCRPVQCVGMASWFEIARVHAAVMSHSTHILYVCCMGHGQCVLSNTCMALGANLISQQESNGPGILWSNVFDPISVDDSFSVGAVMMMFIFDTLLYFAIAWYLEGVWPGEFGVPKVWYFPFTRAFWCPTRRGPSDEDYASGTGGMLVNKDGKSAHDAVDPTMFEATPDGLPVGLDLRNLRKVFGDKVAVKGTTLQMFEGQILSLLGMVSCEHVAVEPVMPRPQS